MSQVMDNYRQAVAMVTAPEAFLELTTIEQGGCTLKAYQHAPGSLRDLWLMAMMSWQMSSAGSEETCRSIDRIMRA